MSIPLSAPVTYKQALAMAAEAVAAQKVPQTAAAKAMAVTAAAADSTIAARDRAAEHAKQAIQKLWATVNPYSPAEVTEFAARAARIMAAAQSAAARAAAVAQAQQLAAVGVKASATQSVPVDVRAKAAAVVAGKLVLQRPDVTVPYSGDTGKVTAADMTTAAIFQRPAATYRYVVSQGGTDAGQRSADRIDSLVDDNLMLAQRLAQQQVLANAESPPKNLDSRKSKITGYRRVIHPELSRGGTCGMCIAASDRIYKVGELLPIHANCKCTIAAVTEDYDPADDLNSVDLNQLYKDAGGTSAAHLKRTRYKEDNHGELGPVMVPKTKYKPRTTKSKVRVGGTGLVDGKPETPADVASRHLPLLENSLADLRARGVSEDSPQIAYHKQQIARMQDTVNSADKPRDAKPDRGSDAKPGNSPAGNGGDPPKPPTPARPSTTGGEDPKDRINALYSNKTAAADDDQRASVKRWQGRDRFYTQVQDAAEDEKSASEETLQVAHDLRELAQPLPEDVQVWRGIRSIEDTFKASIDQLAGRPGEIIGRFMATSVHEQVARDEFTQPGRNPAMLKITARKGARAAWLAPLGDTDMAYQGELLFQPGVMLRILSVDTSGDVPVIEVEVSQP